MKDYTNIVNKSDDIIDRADIIDSADINEYDIEKADKIKLKKIKLKGDRCSIIKPLLISLFIIIVIYINIPHNNEYKKDEIKKAENVNIINSINKVDKCSDYKYGCCKIYYHCDNDGNYDYITISPNIIVKQDYIGSNCPTLNELVNLYNKNYKYKSTNNCNINTFCDSKIRSVNGSIIPLSNINNSDKCYNILDIINLYEENWPVIYNKNIRISSYLILLIIYLYFIIYII